MGIALLLLVDCGDNVTTLPDVPETPTEQVNENANVVCTDYSSRMEMPRLQLGVNLFLVRTVPVYGVNYCAEYDCAQRATRWVAFRWDFDNTVDKGVGRTDKWAEDEQIPDSFRVHLTDHTNDGYDRGHMLASEDRQNSVEANEQTFLMTNMHPQYNQFNASPYVWGNMEKWARTLYANWRTSKPNVTQDTIYVVKGGTIDNDGQILEETVKGLVVPRYFFMAFLYKNNQASQGGYKAMALWVEHTDGKNRDAGSSLAKYMISIDELERRTGIDFFCNLPDQLEEVVEHNAVPAAWGFPAE